MRIARRGACRLGTSESVARARAVRDLSRRITFPLIILDYRDEMTGDAAQDEEMPDHVGE